MTSKELDERIAYVNSHFLRKPKEHDQATKKLIRDCIEAVKPELKVWGKQNGPYDNPDKQEGYNEAIWDTEANKKELLG